MVIVRTRIGKPGRPLGGIPAIVIAQAIVIASYAGVISSTSANRQAVMMRGKEQVTGSMSAEG